MRCPTRSLQHGRSAWPFIGLPGLVEPWRRSGAAGHRVGLARAGPMLAAVGPHCVRGPDAL